MHIVHVVESFAGGVYDFLVDLINHMPQHDHTVVYAMRPNTPRRFDQNFPTSTRFVYWKNATREICLLRDFKALAELLGILKSTPDIDVLHLHSSKAGFLGRVAARILGMQDRVIYTSHGVSFLRKDVSEFKQKIFVMLERLGEKAGGTVVACSKSEMEEFHRHGLRSIYINNAIDCRPPKEKPPKKKTLCIGTVGRISYPKNPSLFNQIAVAFGHDRSVTFKWIGDGHLKKELFAPNITVTGWLDRQAVARELATVDIYLSTSLWEGLPLSALQAMCAGKPLVLSECVGNKDLIKTNRNGLLYTSLFDAIDFIMSLQKDPAKRLALGRASREIFNESFRFDRFVSEYTHLYATISQKERIAR